MAMVGMGMMGIFAVMGMRTSSLFDRDVPGDHIRCDRDVPRDYKSVYIIRTLLL